MITLCFICGLEVSLLSAMIFRSNKEPNLFKTSHISCGHSLESLLYRSGNYFIIIMEKIVTVKMLSGSTIDIQIDFTKTALDLKKKIIEEKGLVPTSPDIYKIVYAGKLMDEETPLNKILFNKSEVHMANLQFLRKMTAQQYKNPFLVNTIFYRYL